MVVPIMKVYVLVGSGYIGPCRELFLAVFFIYFHTA